MDYFAKRENVEQYKRMLADYDNSWMMQQVRRALPQGSSLLELGMGTGVDLLSLAEDYHVLGSDHSPLFVEDFRAQHADIDVCVLDAVDFSLEQRFDCIFSNKVLQHLSPAQAKASLCCQQKHLAPGGMVLMSLWRGPHRTEFMDTLRFVYYEVHDLLRIVPDGLHIEQVCLYTEMETDDSMLVRLRA